MVKHLLIDADDTLWENNIYFEQAIDDFIAFLQHSTLSQQEIRAILLEIEMTIGYGSLNFTKSLEAAYRRLVEHEVRDEDIRAVRIFGERILQHPMELLAGVEETLVYLAPKYHLILLTKGAEEEQRLKVENSGLENYFRDILIVPEKNRATYERVLQQFEFEPGETWMIGNSPRSDINPALAAGLNAVFIPHPQTWAAEHEGLAQAEAERLLVLERFAQLREHF